MKQIIQSSYVITDADTNIASKLQAHMDGIWDEKFNKNITTNELIYLPCKILMCWTSDTFSEH